MDGEMEGERVGATGKNRGKQGTGEYSVESLNECAEEEYPSRLRVPWTRQGTKISGLHHVVLQGA